MILNQLLRQIVQHVPNRYFCLNLNEMSHALFSVIIPVYNRPDEVDELLKSLTKQCYQNFQGIVVEDGSQIPCKEVVDRYADKLSIK